MTTAAATDTQVSTRVSPGMTQMEGDCSWNNEPVNAACQMFFAVETGLKPMTFKQLDMALSSNGWGVLIMCGHSHRTFLLGTAELLEPRNHMVVSINDAKNAPTIPKLSSCTAENHQFGSHRMVINPLTGGLDSRLSH